MLDPGGLGCCRASPHARRGLRCPGHPCPSSRDRSASLGGPSPRAAGEAAAACGTDRVAEGGPGPCALSRSSAPSASGRPARSRAVAVAETRSDAHALGLFPCDGPRREPSERTQPELAGGARLHHHARARVEHGDPADDRRIAVGVVLADDELAHPRGRHSRTLGRLLVQRRSQGRPPGCRAAPCRPRRPTCARARR